MTTTTVSTTAPTTTNTVAADKPNTAMSILSYLGFFALVPLFLKRDDAFLQWHARQGLGLLAVVVAISVVLTVLAMIFLPTIFSLINMVVLLAAFAMSIYGMIKAVGGERWTMPVIGPVVNKS